MTVVRIVVLTLCVATAVPGTAVLTGSVALALGGGTR